MQPDKDPQAAPVSAHGTRRAVSLLLYAAAPEKRHLWWGCA